MIASATGIAAASTVATAFILIALVITAPRDAHPVEVIPYGAAFLIASPTVLFFLIRLLVWCFGASGRHQRREEQHWTGFCRFILSGVWAMACVAAVAYAATH